MPDRGAFRVQSDTLREHAPFWGDRARDVRGAAELISPGVGMGHKFGFLAGANGVSAAYDSWSRSMADALADAQTAFSYLQAAVTSAADDYDGVDATVAADMATLDGKIEP